MDKIVTRVAKLLAMAESTSNEHEAAAFMEKAMALMEQHAIEEHQLKGANAEVRVTFQDFELPARQTGVKALRRLLAAVAELNRCKVMRMGPQSTTHYRVYGFSPDIDFTIRLYESLSTQMASACAREAFIRTQTQKNSFYHAFVGRVWMRLQEAKAVRETEMSNSNALVLIDRKAEVERSLGRTRKAGMGKPGARDLTATQAGDRAGRNANLSQTGLGGTRKELT